jgi:low temperature requirement protein LtrA
MRMSDERAERGPRVTPLELFLDLVFVFAFTQVTSFLSRDPTWGGLLRGLLVLGALWWAWAAYAWLTNTLDPEEDVVRMAVLAAVAAMLVVSLAAPRAFGTGGVIFGIAYLLVRLLHLVLYAIAGRGDRDLFGAVLRLVPPAALGPALLLAGGFFHGSGQIALWGAALAVDYLGPVVGHMRGWRVSPEHFVERHGLIMIIALGESIVSIGVGAAKLPLHADVIGAALLGFVVVACLWWSYFDWTVYVSQARLAEMTGTERARFARDGFSYLHLPMVGGVVLFAFGLKEALAHLDRSIAFVPAVGLCGGVGLYFLAHVALRLRIGGGFGRGRPVATVVLLGLIPLATRVSPLTALGLVAGVCVALIAYEALRHRESRAWIRGHRDGFSMDDARAAVVHEAERRARRAGSAPPDGARRRRMRPKGREP